MLKTDEVFHCDRLPLNDLALLKVALMLVTLETSHPFRLPLKAIASWNIPPISSNEDVFQRDISPLKLSNPANILFMDVTRDTSQCVKSS